MQTIETKSTDANDAFGDIHRTFHAFRETNDERLSQIEQRMSSDVVTEEKLTRIDRALDETKRRLDRAMLDQSRPRLAAETKQDDHTKREHKEAFRNYMRSGDSLGLKMLEEKAMSGSSGADGGYLVTPAAETDILRRMANISPIRAIASVREISTSSYRKAFSTTGPATGWVAETDARPTTANQQIADMSFPAMELYAMPAATQVLLDDTIVDIEQWIASEVDTVFAEQEGAAFVNGNGTNKPTGFLNYTKTTLSTWAWGKTAYVPTGVAGACAASIPSDILIDLVYSLRAGDRQIAGLDPQIQDDDGRIYLGAAGHAGRDRDLDEFPRRRSRRHARRCDRFLLHRLRGFPPGLSRGGSSRHSRFARSLFLQALCVVLHHQARGWRLAGFRCDQVAQVRRFLITAPRPSPSVRCLSRRAGGL